MNDRKVCTAEDAEGRGEVSSSFSEPSSSACLRVLGGSIPAAITAVFMFPSDAAAMHLSDGLLPAGWAVLWSALALPFLFLSIMRIRKVAADDLSFKPLLGLIAAAVFIVSALPIPVPTAGTCSHPCGTAISAILVGPLVSTLVASAALLIQAFVLGHGGLSTWGANIISMGVVGSFTAWMAFRGLRSAGASLWMAAFAAGLIADWATYATTAAELSLALQGQESFTSLFLAITAAFVPTQLPIGALEGFMAAGMIGLLEKRRPDLLIRFRILRPEEVVA